jgi:hypothetical protein
MLMKTSLSVRPATSLRRASTSAPRFPIRIPGRAVWILTDIFSARRSITIRLIPAW